ncbi:MAG: hypothetical protein AB7T31_15150 [Gemmatimonadales bacterium]
MRAVVTVGMLLTFAGCGGVGNQTEAPVDPAAVRISGGTSFGMCAGYCVTELRLDSLSLTLVETSWRTDLPERTRTIPLERSAWEHLQALVDTAAFRRLEGVHGCPDCADGGAEWVEIETAEAAGPVRVTFEYGAALDGIEELQAAIRELRDRFER